VLLLALALWYATVLFVDQCMTLLIDVIAAGERPYKCMMCAKTFNQKGALQIHLMKHTGDRPYLCEFCPSAFSQRGNLRAHIQVLVWKLLLQVTFTGVRLTFNVSSTFFFSELVLICWECDCCRECILRREDRSLSTVNSAAVCSENWAAWMLTWAAFMLTIRYDACAQTFVLQFTEFSDVTQVACLFSLTPGMTLMSTFPPHSAAWLHSIRLLLASSFPPPFVASITALCRKLFHYVQSAMYNLMWMIIIAWKWWFFFLQFSLYWRITWLW